MEHQARYWMLPTKRKHGDDGDNFGSRVLAASQRYNLYGGDSWEEQAFAEDAAGGLGGCVWPPRSYTCSFCRREFKSAQALGGHMNVHRRDRARLKQSSPTQQQQHSHVLPPTTDNINVLPPPPPHHGGHIIAQYHYSPPPPPPARVSTSSLPTTRGVSVNPPPPIFFSSSILSENYAKKTTIMSAPASADPQSWSNLVADKCLLISDFTNGVNTNTTTKSKSNVRATKSTIEEEEEEEHVKEADLLSDRDDQGLMNLLRCQTRTHSNAFDDDDDDDDDDEEFGRCNKRRRLIEYHHETCSSNKFLLNPTGRLDRCRILQPNLSPNSSTMGDLDLELRLGDPPKV